jgi:hypothetical protein
LLYDEKPGLLTSGSALFGVNPEEFWLGFDLNAMFRSEAAPECVVERFAASHDPARQKPAVLVGTFDEHHPVRGVDDAGFGAEFQAARQAPVALQHARDEAGQLQRALPYLVSAFELIASVLCSTLC